MPEWLIDDPTLVYLFLGLIAFALCVGWWMNRGEEPGSMQIGAWFNALKNRRLTRNQSYAFGLTIIALLVIGIWLIGRTGMTDAKRIRIALEEMAAGVKEKNLDKIFKHVSEKFNKKGVTKQELRQRVQRYIRNEDITNVVLFDFYKRVISKEKGTATIKFSASPQGNLARGEYYRCSATFVRDPDGEWRLQSFKICLLTVDPDLGEELELPW
jgi:hypothetical protein